MSPTTCLWGFIQILCSLRLLRPWKTSSAPRAEGRRAREATGARGPCSSQEQRDTARSPQATSSLAQVFWEAAGSFASRPPWKAEVSPQMWCRAPRMILLPLRLVPYWWRWHGRGHGERSAGVMPVGLLGCRRHDPGLQAFGAVVGR